MSDKHYLLWRCHDKQNCLIVATSFKSMIETFKVAQEKYWDAKALNYLVGEELALPSWYNVERDVEKDNEDIRCFAGWVAYIIDENVDFKGSFKSCEAVPDDDEDDDDYLDYHKSSCVCFGTKIVPVKETWRAIYERAANLPFGEKQGWRPLKRHPV